MHDLNIPFITYSILYILISILIIIFILIHSFFKYGVKKKDFKKLGYSKADIEEIFLKSENLINDLSAFFNTDYKTQIIKIYGLPNKIKDLKKYGVDIKSIDKCKRVKNDL